MKWVLGILVILIGGLIGISQMPVLRVDCQTQYGVCDEDLIAAMPDFKNHKWLETLPPFPNLASIDHVTVTKPLPGMVHLDISLRKNLIVVYSTVNQTQILADANGLLLEIKHKTNLPRLLVDRELAIGEKINDPELQAGKILYQVSVVVLSPITGKIVGNDLQIKINDKQTLVIALQQENFTWLSPLQAILARSKIDGKIPQKIDLRFDNPVVVY